ncbi:MAG: circularly permuted type 2 ATP-grasp protein [Pseudomonadota bacterium]|nr:circularly permuted type 2 ATP-grasp protein [Pseudomonadota bacterium]
MPHPLLAHYPRANQRFDELFDANGAPRAHWRAMFDSLSNEPADRMRQRIDTMRRQVRENGVTYNVYADPKGMERPWDLNVVPHILPAQEWQEIEAAVIQRAGLLNRILGDVFGPQRLVREGLLPPSLIAGNPGFLRPCHGISQQDEVALHCYAVDLARAPDGRWWIVADRTQAPSGAGYALENRIVISRAFPELFRDMRVQHLASFFTTLRDSLAHWGRRCAANRGDGADTSPELQAGEQPFIVLLTPGPFNETYYEQSYLARYLGLTLVEGGDLTVRNGLVWLKTLGGPRRVHVILRRVDDEFCDPLELRADSALGVAGLTEAARRGTVLIANGLGANLLESGALLGYLPALSRHLLGEELKMPSVATWWCGEPSALADALAGLDHLVVKPAFAQSRQHPIFGEDLDAAARQQLGDRMRANPGHFVAQEQVRISQSPVWQDHVAGLSAAATGMRVFACATPHGYVVMPGGLTRVATGPDARVITMQRGGSSKDTWVCANEPANPLSLLLQGGAGLAVRSDGQLPSRMVENLFWFGRYSERCDNLTRLLRAAFDVLSNLAPEQRGGEWPTLQRLCQGYRLTANSAPTASAVIDDGPFEAALFSAIAQRDGNGLAANLHHLHRVAGHLRERLSHDNWRTINQLLQLPPKVGHGNRADAIGLLDDLTGALMTLSGFALDGMTRDSGWRFLQIGRRLERLQFMATVLTNGLAMAPSSRLEWLLEVGDSSITYRSRYTAQAQWGPVLDLLISDATNPRALAFQLGGLIDDLEQLAVSYGECGAQTLRPLLCTLQALPTQQQLHWGSQPLAELLRQLDRASVNLSEQLGLQFFSHTGDVSQGSFAP